MPSASEQLSGEVQAPPPCTLSDRRIMLCEELTTRGFSMYALIVEFSIAPFATLLRLMPLIGPSTSTFRMTKLEDVPLIAMAADEIGRASCRESRQMLVVDVRV